MNDISLSVSLVIEQDMPLSTGERARLEGLSRLQGRVTRIETTSPEDLEDMANDDTCQLAGRAGAPIHDEEAE